MTHKNDLVLRSPFTSPKDGIYHTNRMKLRPHEGYIQIWVDNKPAGFAGMRLTEDQMREVVSFIHLNYGIKA